MSIKSKSIAKASTKKRKRVNNSNLKTFHLDNPENLDQFIQMSGLTEDEIHRITSNPVIMIRWQVDQSEILRRLSIYKQEGGVIPKIISIEGRPEFPLLLDENGKIIPIKIGYRRIHGIQTLVPLYEQDGSFQQYVSDYDKSSHELENMLHGFASMGVSPPTREEQYEDAIKRNIKLFTYRDPPTRMLQHVIESMQPIANNIEQNNQNRLLEERMEEIRKNIKKRNAEKKAKRNAEENQGKSLFKKAAKACTGKNCVVMGGKTKSKSKRKYL